MTGDLNDAFNVLLCEVLFEFGLAILDYGFADELATLNPSLIDDHFVVLSELNLVVLDSLVEGFVFVVSLLDIVDYLQQIDGYRKNLSSGLQHLLVLLDLLFVLLLELTLVLAFIGGAAQDLLEFGL